MIAALSAAVRNTGIHAVMGTGGAPEGVLAAAALKCLGGEIQGRFRPRNDDERRRLEAAGGSTEKIYTTDDLAPGKNIVFSATGITDGDLLRGVRFFKDGARTHTVSLGTPRGWCGFPTRCIFWARGRSSRCRYSSRYYLVITAGIIWSAGTKSCEATRSV